MPRPVRSLCSLALGAALALVLAGTASADSGAITITSKDQVDELAMVGVSVTVDKTACDSPASCNWRPMVSRVAAGQPCDPEQLMFLGEVVSGTGQHTQAFPGRNMVTVAEPRLCLYLQLPDDLPPRLVGQLDVPFDAPAPEPAPQPAPQPAPPATLGMAIAKSHVKPILKQVFKARFTQRRAFRRTCMRRSAGEVRCVVRWTHRRLRFKGPLTIKAAPDHPNGVTFDEQIRKRRIR